MTESTLQVELEGLSPFAVLSGKTGESSVEPVGSRLLLRGMFRLRFGAFESDWRPFATDVAEAAEVVRGGDGRLSLRSVPLVYFAFSTLIDIRTDADGPRLRCDRVSLARGTAAGAPVLLSLATASVSLVPDAPYRSDNYFVIPTAAGTEETRLAALRYPGLQVRGFYVRPGTAGRLAVHLGRPEQRIRMDHCPGVQLEVHDDTPLVFELSAVTDGRTAREGEGAGFFLDGSSASLGVALRISGATGAYLGDSPPEPGKWTASRVRTVAAGQGWATVTAFADTGIGFGIAAEEQGVGGAAGTLVPLATVRARSETVRFHLPLPAAQASGDAAPQLLYHDPTVEDAQAVAGPRRFEGLRVHGLGHVGGSAAWLDASWIQLAVRADVGGGATAFLRAGVPMELPAVDNRTARPAVRSLLVPKADPRRTDRRRRLEVPVGALSLVVEPGEGAAGSPLSLDTGRSGEEFGFHDPRIEGAPLGTPAQGAPARRLASDDAPAFARWQLRVPEQSDGRVLPFHLSPRGVFPTAGEGWLDAVQPLPNQDFALLQHPGTGIVMDPEVPGALRDDFLRVAADDEPRSSVGISFDTPSGKEVLVYSAVVAALSYPPVRARLFAKEKAVEKPTIRVKNLDAPAMKRWVKSRAVDNLRIVYFDPDGTDADEGIREFIDASQPKEPADRLLWPLALGLSVLLKDQVRYAPEIGRARGAKPGLAFDFSAEHSLDPAGDLGYGKGWKELADASRALWPRAGGQQGARHDPSDRLWRGIFLRGLPLTLGQDEATLARLKKEAPVLYELYVALDRALVLDYGWFDETGPTWHASFAPQPPIALHRKDWEDQLTLSLTRFVTKGAAGRMVAAEGEVEAVLAFLKEDQKPAPKIRGTFLLNLANGFGLDRIEFALEGGLAIDTGLIPGFRQVVVRSFATDFRRVAIRVQLVPTSELAAALPFLRNQEGLEVTLGIGLAGEGPVRLTAELGTEIETNLFGRWPLTLQGLGLSVSSAESVLSFRGWLNLGLGAATRLGASVTLQRKDGKWNLAVAPDFFDGSLEFGGFSLRGALRWVDPVGPGTDDPLDSAVLATRGKERDIRGLVTLKSEPFGELTVLLRIGSRGEMTFWVAALGTSREISLGPARLKEPLLLLAHNADYEGGLAKVVREVTRKVDEAIRPEAGKEWEWLGKWNASPDIGTLVAASGQFDLVKGLAEAPSEDKHRTSVLVATGGLYRIDSYALFAGQVVRFALAIDTRAGVFSAGLQGPSIKVTPEKVEYEISAGYVALSIRYRSPRAFDLRVGWPELTGQGIERDWGRSVKVYWKDAWPINTFWGGTRIGVDERTREFVYGVALRAGYTYTVPPKGISGIAEATVDAGVALGGVVEFVYQWGTERLALPAVARLRALAAAAAALALADTGTEGVQTDDDALGFLAAAFRAPDAESMGVAPAARAALAGVSEAEVLQDVMYSLAENVGVLGVGTLRASVYGDIWGNASAKLLGVTIGSISISAHSRYHFCGDTKRGVVRAFATTGFKVSVRIACVTYSAKATVELTIVDRGSC